jgi:hypothetical protein
MKKSSSKKPNHTNAKHAAAAETPTSTPTPEMGEGQIENAEEKREGV